MLTSVSQSKEPEDYLSLSASLFEILRYVDGKDIMNCELVNRRLYSVIKENDKYLPRTEASLQLVFSRSPTCGNEVEVSLSAEEGLEFDRWTSYYLSEGEVKENRDQRDDRSILRLLTKCEIKKDGQRIGYRSPSTVSHNLCSLLETIFRRCNFRSILILDMDTTLNTQEEYLSLIADLLEKSSTKCEELLLPKMDWPLLKKLLKQLELRNVEKEVFALLNREHLDLTFRSAMPSESLLIFMQSLIKRWESGECSFQCLAVLGKNPSAQTDVHQYLKSLEWFKMKSFVSIDIERYVEFSRPLDSRILTLFYIDVGTGECDFNFTTRNES